MKILKNSIAFCIRYTPRKIMKKFSSLKRINSYEGKIGEILAIDN